MCRGMDAGNAPSWACFDGSRRSVGGGSRGWGRTFGISIIGRDPWFCAVMGSAWNSAFARTADMSQIGSAGGDRLIVTKCGIQYNFAADLVEAEKCVNKNLHIDGEDDASNG